MSIAIIQERNGTIIVYLNDYRIVGPKHSGGGREIYRGTVQLKHIQKAIGL